MFYRKQKEKTEDLTPKQAGKLWNKLDEKAKNKFIKEYAKKKEKFETYLLEVEGIKLKYKGKVIPVSPMAETKPDHFRTKRVRTVLGAERLVWPLAKPLMKGLASVMGQFMEDLGDEIDGQLRKELGQVANFDTAYNAIESCKRYDFLNKSSFYNMAINSILEEKKQKEEKKRKEAENAFPAKRQSRSHSQGRK